MSRGTGKSTIRQPGSASGSNSWNGHVSSGTSQIDRACPIRRVMALEEFLARPVDKNAKRTAIYLSRYPST